MNTAETKNIAELFGIHDLDLTGFSDTVTARFKEAIRRAGRRDDNMVFPDGCEMGMIGTMVNEHGIEVPVYETELSIRSKMKSYGADWETEIGGYTDEQLADAGFMESELYTMAEDDFSFNTLGELPNRHEHAPVIMRALDDIEERGDSTRWDIPIVGKLDPRWDDAFVGTIENSDGMPVAVYEFGLLVKSIMATDGVSDSGARKRIRKYFEKGINGVKPAILYGFKVDSDRWNAIRMNINYEIMEDFLNV